MFKEFGDSIIAINLPFAFCFDFILPVVTNERRKAMEAVVPAEIAAELTQVLSNLVFGDNEIRSK